MDYVRTLSGLEVACESQDERSVQRDLREYDSELRLVPQAGGYQVRRWRGPDRPSEFLFAWVDANGDPLPLSSRMMDMVRLHDRNTRGRALDADVANAAKHEQDARDWDAQVEAATGDWAAKHGRPVLPRSTSLRMSRDKQRAKGKKV
jgi:hypothetical protein